MDSEKALNIMGKKMKPWPFTVKTQCNAGEITGGLRGKRNDQ